MILDLFKNLLLIEGFRFMPLVALNSYAVCFMLSKYCCSDNKFLPRNRHLNPHNTNGTHLSRLGGLGIFLATLIYFFLTRDDSFIFDIYVLGIPIFLLGLTEDLYMLWSARQRMILIIFTVVTVIITTNIFVFRIGIIGFDWLLAFVPVSALFTIIAVSGLVNAYNIIDGLNGLASFMALICMVSVSLIAFLCNDQQLIYYSLINIGAIFGFFLLNYPQARIFLGDCGAYWIGYLCAFFSILLIMRNQEVSPFLALIINIYPITETIYSIYRRMFITGSSFGAPDLLHLHSLVLKNLHEKKGSSNYGKNLNSIATACIALPTLAFVLIGLVFYQSSIVLSTLLVAYVICYSWQYKKLLKLK